MRDNALVAHDPLWLHAVAILVVAAWAVIAAVCYCHRNDPYVPPDYGYVTITVTHTDGTADTYYHTSTSEWDTMGYRTYPHDSKIRIDGGPLVALRPGDVVTHGHSK